jgi:hypothetical protein
MEDGYKQQNPMLPKLDVYFAADLIWHSIKDMLDALPIGQGLKFQFEGSLTATVIKEEGQYHIKAPGEEAWYTDSPDVTDAVFFHTVGSPTDVKNVAKLLTITRI